MLKPLQISSEAFGVLSLDIGTLRRDLHTSHHNISGDGTEIYKKTRFILHLA